MELDPTSRPPTTWTLPMKVDVAVVEAPPTKMGPSTASLPPKAEVGVEVPMPTTPFLSITKLLTVDEATRNCGAELSSEA